MYLQNALTSYIINKTYIFEGSISMLQRFEHFMGKFVHFLFFLIILYLNLTFLFSSAYVTIYEKIYIEPSKTANIALAVVLFTILTLLHKKFHFLNNIHVSQKQLIFIYGGIAILFVIMFQIIPAFDQYDVLTAAHSFHSQDFTVLLPGGYLHKYPFQLGLVMVLYYLEYFWGGNNYIAFSLLNVIALCSSLLCLEKLHRIISKTKSKLLLICEFCFLPMIFYTTFLYGTLIGLSFALWSIYYLIVYLRENESIKNLVFCALFITLSLLFKTNFLIVLCAICLILFSKAIVTKKPRLLLMILLLLFCYKGITALPTAWAHQLSGVEISSGISNYGWIEMGTQEGFIGPGMYNDYTVSVYNSCSADLSLTEYVYKRDLKETLTEFLSDPAYMINFYARKLTCEWLDPSFESFVIFNRNSNTYLSTWMEQLKHGPLLALTYSYMYYYEAIILFGLLCWTVLHKASSHIEDYILVITFIGGFLFHILWEGKAQYTFIYLFLVIPYAVLGYSEFADRLLTLPQLLCEIKCQSKLTLKPLLQKNYRFVLSILIYLVLAAGIYCSSSPYINNVFKLGESSDDLITYKEQLMQDID